MPIVPGIRVLMRGRKAMDSIHIKQDHAGQSAQAHEHEHDLEGLAPRFFNHAQVPCNIGKPPHWDGRALGVGVCGDSIEVFIHVDGSCLRDVRHLPKGCVYTVACGSAVSKLAQGRPLEEVLKIQPQDVAAELGGLPADHMHCANLAVNTLGEALDDYYRKVWGNNAETPKSASTAGE